MDSMKLPRGPLVSVFGTAVVLFVFFLALSFGWSWWEFLVVEAAVLAALFVCNDSVKEEFEWECVGIFISLAVLGFAAQKAELSVALVNVERFLANHATAVQAVAAIVMVLFTAALWQATRKQAEATRALQELQEEQSRGESTPLLFAQEVSATYVYDRSEEKDGAKIWLPPEIKIYFRPLVNLGKYGVLLRRVELISFSENGEWEAFGRMEIAFPVPAGESKAFPVQLTNWLVWEDKVTEIFFKLHDGAASKGDVPAQAYIRLALLYAGNPSKENYLCFRLRVVETVAPRQLKLAAVPADCPASARDV